MSFQTRLVALGSGSGPTPPPAADCCCCDEDVTLESEAGEFPGSAMCFTSNNTIGKTNASDFASNRFRFAGFWVGTSEDNTDPCCPDSSLRETGVYRFAAFTTAGGSPNAGDPVFLALASDDAGTGAGKLTATPPSAVGQIIAEVGICKSSADYAGLKICKVLIQVKEPKVITT